MCRLHLVRIDQLSAAILELSTRIEDQMGPFARQLDQLATIPGVGQATAEVIIAETGADMTRFRTAGHLASWAGVCPGHHESAGKRKSGKTRHGNRWLGAALGTAAMAASRTKDTTYLAKLERVIPMGAGAPADATPADKAVLNASFRTALERARDADSEQARKTLLADAQRHDDDMLRRGVLTAAFELGELDTVSDWVREHTTFRDRDDFLDEMRTLRGQLSPERSISIVSGNSRRWVSPSGPRKWPTCRPFGRNATPSWPNSGDKPPSDDRRPPPSEKRAAAGHGQPPESVARVPSVEGTLGNHRR